jgi:hypothetical protein
MSFCDSASRAFTSSFPRRIEKIDVRLPENEDTVAVNKIRQLAQILNQYANLLMVFVTVMLVWLTGKYVRLTSRTLTALEQASLREREARHLQQIKDGVILPAVSWIRGTVFERFTGKTPALLTISGGHDVGPNQICHTIDDPFRARTRLATPFDRDARDPLATWSSTENGRISMFLCIHSRHAHFSQELSEFDRLVEDVSKLTGAFILFAKESAKEIADPEIPEVRHPADEGVMAEWTNSSLLAVDCIQTILQGEKDPPCEFRIFPDFQLLMNRNNLSVAKSARPEKLKRWRELGLSRVRNRWEGSDLRDRVGSLLKNADRVCQNMDALLFTQTVGIDCELVSGKKSKRQR